MEPSKEVSAATQPVVNRAPRIMPVEKPALALQMDSATPKISGEPCICTCPHYLSFNERGANGTVQPPTLLIGQGTCTKNNLTGPPHTGASPCPSPPHPPSSHYLSFTASCVSRPGANGAKNYHSPSLQSHTTYLWNLQPITQVKSILQNLTPTCTLPAREHQLPHNQRINVAPT